MQKAKIIFADEPARSLILSLHVCCDGYHWISIRKRAFQSSSHFIKSTTHLNIAKTLWLKDGLLFCRRKKCRADQATIGKLIPFEKIIDTQHSTTDVLCCCQRISGKAMSIQLKPGNYSYADNAVSTALMATLTASHAIAKEEINFALSRPYAQQNLRHKEPLDLVRR